jgi:hypothetical protein
MNKRVNTYTETIENYNLNENEKAKEISKRNLPII